MKAEEGTFSKEFKGKIVSRCSREASRIDKAPHGKASRTRAIRFARAMGGQKEKEGVRIFMKGLESTLTFYSFGWKKIVPEKTDYLSGKV